MQLTSEQAAILAATDGESDLMVIARAGCGKTFTITLIEPRLRGGTLALAFNVKIRDELKQKLSPSAKVMTLNGLGFSAWMGFVRKEMNVDAKKTYNLTIEAQKKMGLSLSRDEREDLSDLINRAKALGWVPSGAPGSPRAFLRDEQVDVVFDACDISPRDDLTVLLRWCMLESIKQGLAGQIDFNDQIYLPVIYRAPFRAYDNVIVDEAQDLSALNHEMILRSCRRRLIVVGDDRQAIYAFRGAMSDSLSALLTRRQFQILPLTTTFRCGKAIVARAQEYVPDYQAHESNPEGEVLDWRHKPWNADSLPAGAAILCRNNAPLFWLAFRLLRKGKPVQMLGSDIGKALERQLLKATKGLDNGAPRGIVITRIEEFFTREIAKATTERKLDSLTDRKECLLAILEEAPTLREAKALCHKLFEEKNNAVILSTGHKAKGLEWNTVIHLCPRLIPSKFAVTDEQLIQERNLKYVVETRPRERLILADTEDFT